MTIAIRTRKPGRRAGRRCVPPSKHLRRKRPCTRTVTVARLTRSAHPGFNKVAFSGRVHREALRPGRYQAVFRAADAAGTSKASTLSFRIVRR